MVDNEENQGQVFRRFPPPLEIAAAIPTFPQPRGERMGKWKSKSRIPTFPPHEYLYRIPITKETSGTEPHGSFRLILRLENAVFTVK